MGKTETNLHKFRGKTGMAGRRLRAGSGNALAIMGLGFPQQRARPVARFKRREMVAYGRFRMESLLLSYRAMQLF